MLLFQYTLIGSYAQTYRYQIQAILPPAPYTNTASVALFSINDLGQAVGRLGFRNRNPLAFLWDQGQAIVLDSGFSGGEALDINNNGIIVGRANGYHPALWDANHVLTYLPVLRSGGIAYAINDSNVVVGTDGQGGLNTIPLKWENGQVVSLCGTIPCTGTAVDINNNGDIIGTVSWYINQDLYGGSWIFKPLEQYNGDDNPPTPDDFIWAEVLAINDQQQVAGYRGVLPFTSYIDTRAIRWENGVVTELDHEPVTYRNSYVRGINNRGDLVGQKHDSAVLWTAEGHEINLNDAIPPGTGWVLRCATDINNAGQIVGYGSFNNKICGFVLTPAQVTITGNVELQDFAGDVTQMPVTVELRQGGNVVGTRTLSLGADGNYAFTASPETYDLAFKARHWLRKVVPNVSASGSSVTVNVSLTNGDIDGDNEVTLFDFGALVSAFGSMPGDSNWNPEADLDGDKEVTLFDFGVLVSNFGAIGDD